VVHKIEHKDFLSQSISIGDIVVRPDNYTNFKLGKIIRLTKKMVRVQNLTGKKKAENYFYPSAVIKVQPQQVTLHMLTYQAK